MQDCSDDGFRARSPARRTSEMWKKGDKLKSFLRFSEPDTKIFLRCLLVFYYQLPKGLSLEDYMNLPQILSPGINTIKQFFTIIELL